MDCSLSGSSVHGIFKARVLEWVAISFSREFSQPRDRTQVSRIVDRQFTVWVTMEVHGYNPTHLVSLILNVTSSKRHFLGPGSQIRCSGILSNGTLCPLQHWQQFTFTNVIVHYACISDQDTPLFQVNGSPSNTEHGLVTLVWHLRLATIWPLGD